MKNYDIHLKNANVMGFSLILRISTISIDNEKLFK